MPAKDPYKAAPKQSEIPKSLCERAAWYLNSIGGRGMDKKAQTRFKITYGAFGKLNIPVMCKPDLSYEERRAGVKKVKCTCYPPLSGLAGKRRRRKGGKGK